MLPESYDAEIERRLLAEANTKAALLALRDDLTDQRIWPAINGPDLSVFTLRLKLLKARVASGSLLLGDVAKELDLLLASLAENHG